MAVGTDRMTATARSTAAPVAAYVETGVPSAAPYALPVPSLLRCGFLIFVMKISLQARGFSRTIGWIRRRVEAIPEVPSVDLKAIKAAEYAVAMAGALYPGRAKCLEQSLCLYYLLRRAGVGARFRMGVQAHPFLAHAWVECGDKPVNDVAEHVRWFTSLPDQLP